MCSVVEAVGTHQLFIHVVFVCGILQFTDASCTLDQESLCAKIYAFDWENECFTSLVFAALLIPVVSVWDSAFHRLEFCMTLYVAMCETLGLQYGKCMFFVPVMEV